MLFFCLAMGEELGTFFFVQRFTIGAAARWVSYYSSGQEGNRFLLLIFCWAYNELIKKDPSCYFLIIHSHALID